ncbi:MAG TPA: FtsX-like permease family protein [Mycobacteriales bacterium]|nr:FtsX-like permease family protein [Mycobacteriales bacterium]
MTATYVDDAALPRRSRGGSLAARRAVIRWSWRLFRREWRQQLLVLGLTIVAVAATLIGGAVATNTPPPANAGFGTAHDLAKFDGADPHLAAEVTALQRRFAPVDIIDNQTLNLPGSVDTYQLRAQNPAGRYGGPMLSLLAGRYPTRAGEVALTTGLESAFHVTVGGTWHEGSSAYTVVGTVRNPQSLLSQFALVAPGQVTTPTQVTVLFDAYGATARSLGKNVQVASGSKYTNPINPETLSLAGLVLGMLLITLVAVGGFTVLAQRRLRSLGMLASLGATDRNISLVVRANGAVVGVVGALIGTAIGFAGWAAYRPHLQTSVHHVIGLFALPWLVVGLAVGLAVVATYLAACWPARAVTRVPVVTALAGRPAVPRQIHRSALPGLVFLGIAFVLLGIAGSTAGTGKNGNAPALVIGLVALIPGVILLSPFALSTLARVSRRAPVAVRLALRDLARYRARSGSALSAIAVTILISSIIVIIAALRYGNALDYAGPNLSSHELALYPASANRYAPPEVNKPPSAAATARMGHAVDAIAATLGDAAVVELDSTSASLYRNAAGRNWNGEIYVATPALLHEYGISASQIEPGAQILTMRPGLAGMSKLQLIWGGKGAERQFVAPGQAHVAARATLPPCTASYGCEPNPVIQHISALPSGTSAPNTVITEGAVRQLHLNVTTSGWLIQTSGTPTPSQINAVKLAAFNNGLNVETKNDQPSASEVINAATGFGIGLALAILAMTIGLIRSETAPDLRTLTAAGATSRTRRSLTAATAGGLALLGALLGTAAGYVAVIGFIRDNSVNGGVAALESVPYANLLAILVGMPLVATLVGWVLAGREPAVIARRALD